LVGGDIFMLSKIQISKIEIFKKSEFITSTLPMFTWILSWILVNICNSIWLPPYIRYLYGKGGNCTCLGSCLYQIPDVRKSYSNPAMSWLGKYPDPAKKNPAPPDIPWALHTSMVQESLPSMTKGPFSNRMPPQDLSFFSYSNWCAWAQCTAIRNQWFLSILWKISATVCIHFY